MNPALFYAFGALWLLVTFLIIAWCLVSEHRFQRRLDRLTLGQVLDFPAQLRVVEPEPEPLHAELAKVLPLRRDWPEGGSAA